MTAGVRVCTLRIESEGPTQRCDVLSPLGFHEYTKNQLNAYERFYTLFSPRPTIGISMDFELRQKPSGKKETSFIYRTYYEALRTAGALPLLLPPGPPEELNYLKGKLDGIVLTGGDDLDPALFGESPRDGLELVHPVRQSFELELARFADRERIPLLGICLGLQVMNVIRGGTLIQNIPAQMPSALPHRKENGAVLFHPVKTTSRLREITGRKIITVNSYHHQAIGKLGEGLVVNAMADDGVIEGVEDPKLPFFMGFQWHLELDREEQPWNQTILKAFLERALQTSEKI